MLMAMKNLHKSKVKRIGVLHDWLGLHLTLGYLSISCFTAESRELSFKLGEASLTLSTPLSENLMEFPDQVR